MRKGGKEKTVDSGSIQESSAALRIKAEAQALGFVAGLSPLAPMPAHESKYQDWVRAGFAAGMDYMVDTMLLRTDPRQLLANASSVISLALPLPCAPEPKREEEAGGFRVAWYAQRRDYHKVVYKRLRRLKAVLRRLFPNASFRGWCDTGPVMEKAWAERCGLGRQGLSTLLLTPGLGSRILLATLLTDLPLPPSPALNLLPPSGVEEAFPGCEGCRRCVSSCPTGALGGEGLLDARRCISYLTVEHRGPVQRQLRPLIGQWAFGCDRCQEVCPHNHQNITTAPASGRQQLPDQEDQRCAPGEGDLATAPGRQTLSPELLSWPDRDLEGHVEGTPMSRARAAGLKRNILTCLGNTCERDRQDSWWHLMASCLSDHPATEVKIHAAWAMLRWDTPSATPLVMAAARAFAGEGPAGDLLGELGLMDMDTGVKTPY